MILLHDTNMQAKQFKNKDKKTEFVEQKIAIFV